MLAWNPPVPMRIRLTGYRICPTDGRGGGGGCSCVALVEKKMWARLKTGAAAKERVEVLT